MPNTQHHHSVSVQHCPDSTMALSTALPSPSHTQPHHPAVLLVSQHFCSTSAVPPPLLYPKAAPGSPLLVLGDCAGTAHPWSYAMPILQQPQDLSIPLWRILRHSSAAGSLILEVPPSQVHQTGLPRFRSQQHLPMKGSALGASLFPLHSHPTLNLPWQMLIHIPAPI